MNKALNHIPTDTNKTTTDYIYLSLMNRFVENLIRFFTSLFVKTLASLVRIFKRGSGYTLPGYFINKYYPAVLKTIQVKKGFILVTGTNGKTTTTKMITQLLTSLGYTVSTNVSGANLLSGIITSLFLDTDFWGKSKGAYAVLEVDEFALPQLLKYISPIGIVLLNVSRDQLDRYGEVDTIITKWDISFKNLTEPYTLVLNEEQAEFHLFSKTKKAEVVFFTADPELLTYTNLRGHFNALNISAAVTLVKSLGMDKNQIVSSLSDLGHAYGRGEVIKYNSQEFHLFLAKNPASLSQNLMFAKETRDTYEVVLFLLNDNIPDGRDVSWIYDVPPELFKYVCENKKIYVSGTRAFDMAVRLTYAGVSVLKDNINNSLNEMLPIIKGNSVLVLPNYSAMLEFRKLLVGRKIL